jgi:hypothetical protein
VVHHGPVDVDPGVDRSWTAAGRVRSGGTTWPGALESDAFRRAFLTQVADVCGRSFVVAEDTDVIALRNARLDALGDLNADHLDTAALHRLIADGPTPGLPFIPPGAPPVTIRVPCSRCRLLIASGGAEKPLPASVRDRPRRGARPAGRRRLRPRPMALASVPAGACPGRPPGPTRPGDRSVSGRWLSGRPACGGAPLALMHGRHTR